MGADRITPVAPWHAGFNPHTAEWHAHTTGDPIRVRYPGATLSETDLSTTYVLCRTIRDVLALHNRGVDTTAIPIDGTPACSDTAGILHRRPTHAYGVVLIGKETRRIDRVGILQGPDYTTYHHPDPWPQTREALRRVATADGHVRRIATGSGVPISTVQRAIDTGRMPTKAARRQLTRWLATDLRHALPADAASLDRKADDDQVIARYLATTTTTQPCHFCGKPLPTSKRNRRYHDHCRQAAYRKRRASEQTE